MTRDRLIPLSIVVVLAAVAGLGMGGCPLGALDGIIPNLTDPNNVTPAPDQGGGNQDDGTNDPNTPTEPDDPEDEPVGDPEDDPEGDPEDDPEDDPEGDPEDDPEDDPEGDPEDDPDDDPDGFTAAQIIHRGSEQIIAGPEVDSSVSTVTPTGYAATGYKAVAISGDATKVWFSLFDEFPNVEGDPQTQLWSVNIDGSGGQRSGLPAEALNYGLPLETTINGSVCYGDNRGVSKMYRTTPGNAATTAFTYWNETEGHRYGDIRGEFQITDDGSKMVYRSFVDSKIYGVNLADGSGTPVAIAWPEKLQHMGTNARYFCSNIAMAGDGSKWVFMSDYYNGGWDTPHQHATWIGSGFDAGASVTKTTVPDTINDVAENFSITDDGQTFAYTVAAEYLNAPSGVMVQPTTGTTRQETGDGRTSVRGSISGDGSRLCYRTSRGFGTGNSVLVDMDTGRKMPPGTGLFDNNPGVDSGNIRVSDDGQTFVAGADRGVWVLHDGVDGQPGFPTIDNVYYRFNDDCTLTVRVAVTAPRGVHQVYVTPYIAGEPPTSVLTADVNPTYSFRWGSWNFERLEGQPGVWEQIVGLTNGDDGACARDLLTSDFVLRIVLYDANETMAVFQDFAPGQ